MVLSGLRGWVNAPPAAVRAKFQGEFLDSSVDIGVDRLALLRSWVPGLIAINEVTSQPVFSDAAQEVGDHYAIDAACPSEIAYRRDTNMHCLLDLPRCTPLGSQ
jgi:hypothetical protein